MKKCSRRGTHMDPKLRIRQLYKARYNARVRASEARLRAIVWPTAIVAVACMVLAVLWAGGIV